MDCCGVEQRITGKQLYSPLKTLVKVLLHFHITPTLLNYIFTLLPNLSDPTRLSTKGETLSLSLPPS